MVGAALREGRHQQTGGGWVWERQEGQPDAAGLPGIQIMGTTQAHPRFTYHAAFAGIGGGVVGFKQAGGCLRGAFEADSRMRRVFEANHDLVPQTSHRRVLSEGWPEEADVLMVGNLTEAPRGSDVLEPRIKLAWDAGRGARYKIAVFEFRASFVGADNGARLGAFQRRLRGCGYQVTTKRLYAPDFGAAVAAWRWWVVGLRGDLAAKGIQFHWPDRCSEHHPLRAMLEWDATKVKGHWIRGTRWRQPACSTREPRPGTRLRQVGWVGCDERGRRVYDVNGLAAPQTGTTHQLDFGNGLYAVGGGVRRLTVRETARVMQVEDQYELDKCELRARKHLGRITLPGMARAMGMQIGRCLQNEQSARTEGPIPMKEPDKPVRTPEEEQWALHRARLMAWQACDAARAAAQRVHGLRDPNTVPSAMRWEQATGWDRIKVRELVRRLHWSRWLRLQWQAGMRGVQRLRKEHAPPSLVEQAEATVVQRMQSEQDRGWGQRGPVQLLWWNWPRAYWGELIEGVRLPFFELPPRNYCDNYDTADCAEVHSEFDRLIKLGYLKEWDAGGGEAKVVSPISAVPKKNSTKKRIVIDMSASGLNPRMTAGRFALPSVEAAVQQAYPGCAFVVADLTDGFYCQTLHRDGHAYVCVRNPKDKKLYYYSVLPMGLASSPHHFCQRTAVAANLLRQTYKEFRPVRYVTNQENPYMPRVYGVDDTGRPVTSVDFYVDDGLLIGGTRESVRAAFKRMEWVYEARLGLRFNRAKTVGPATRVHYLGLEMDSVGDGTRNGACTRVPKARRQRCLDIVHSFLSEHQHSRRAGRRQLASLVGELMFAGRAIPAGRTFLVRLWRCLSEAQLPAEERGDHRNYDRSVPITTGAWLDVRWWLQCLTRSPCIRRWRTRSFGLRRLWTDASGGGYCETLAVPARDGLPAMRFGYGQWSAEQSAFSSNWHELATVGMSLATRLEELRGCKVHYMTDNTTTAAGINNGALRSPKLMKIIREIRLLEAAGDVELEAYHIPGHHIVQQGADGGSRQHPYLGQLGAHPREHDTFDPVAWPLFTLCGDLLRQAHKWRARPHVLDATHPDTWATDVAGRDSFWHVRPSHGEFVFRKLLDAQLRRPADTAFTVIIPLLCTRPWRQYLRHFRRKRRLPLPVPGLGVVQHLVLRYEHGDGLLGKAPLRDAEGWVDVLEEWGDSGLAPSPVLLSE